MYQHYLHLNGSINTFSPGKDGPLSTPILWGTPFHYVVWAVDIFPHSTRKVFTPAQILVKVSTYFNMYQYFNNLLLWKYLGQNTLPCMYLYQLMYFVYPLASARFPVCSYCTSNYFPEEVLSVQLQVLNSPGIDYRNVGILCCSVLGSLVTFYDCMYLINLLWRWNCTLPLEAS